MFYVLAGIIVAVLVVVVAEGAIISNRKSSSKKSTSKSERKETSYDDDREVTNSSNLYNKITSNWDNTENDASSIDSSESKYDNIDITKLNLEDMYMEYYDELIWQLEHCNGYSLSVYFADVTNDGLKDMLVTVIGMEDGQEIVDEGIFTYNESRGELVLSSTNYDTVGWERMGITDKNTVCHKTHYNEDWGNGRGMFSTIYEVSSIDETGMSYDLIELQYNYKSEEYLINGISVSKDVYDKYFEEYIGEEIHYGVDIIEDVNDIKKEIIAVANSEDYNRVRLYNSLHEREKLEPFDESVLQSDITN
jgi:hypothetical protein